jgi:DNA-binding MarR family transcriptional regulator
MSPAAPFPITENARVGPALASLGRYVTAAYRRALVPTGLAARHVETLRRLGARVVTQRDLGIELRIDPPKLVGVLNELEREGLIARQRDPADRRRHNVSLTPLGEARLAGVEHAISRVEDELLAGLDAVQRSYLAGVLDALAARAGIVVAAEVDEASA